jgi:predicted small secreted protein
MYATFEERTMKPMIAVLIVAALMLVGCNTVQGIGQDLEKAGESIEKAAK